MPKGTHQRRPLIRPVIVKPRAYVTAAVCFALLGLVLLYQSLAATPISQDKTDQLSQSFQGSKYTSKYHLYAAGLDWSKPVGLLVYADGSGEFGLKNPTSSYLLSGNNGLVSVAKRNNMVLLTPFSPNTDCADGDGSCWYMGDPEGYAAWAEELVTAVEASYPLDTSRVAFGGYSSGAQLATEYWVPSGAAQRTMSDGVIVAISYGGSPKMKEVAYDAAFKSGVPIVWNVGDKDPSYKSSGQYGVQAGYDAYTANGFDTHLTVVPGLGHDRDGQFGSIMEEQIKSYVGPGSTTPPPAPPTTPPTTPPTPPTTPPGPTPQNADLNSDGKVNLSDLSILLSNWGAVKPQADKGDINGDGAVNLSDLSILLSKWTP